MTHNISPNVHIRPPRLTTFKNNHPIHGMKKYYRKITIIGTVLYKYDFVIDLLRIII